MASRPTTIPQLDTTKANRTIPAAGKVTSGYSTNDLFPAASANYLHGWAGDWLEWLQERTEDGTTPTTDLGLRALDALVVTGDGGDVVITAGDGGGTSGDGGDVVITAGGVTSGTKGTVILGVDGADEYTFGATEADFHDNDLDNVGLAIIEGISVGHTGTPIADQVSVGDLAFRVKLDGVTPSLIWDVDNDTLYYDRINDIMKLKISNVDEYTFDATEADFNGNNLTGVGTIACGVVTSDTVNATASGSGRGLSGTSTGGLAAVFGQGSGAAGVEGSSTNAGSAGIFGRSSGSFLAYGVMASSGVSSPVKSALRLIPQGSDPSSPLQGDVYVNSGDGTLRIYNGSAWVVVGTQT